MIFADRSRGFFSGHSKIFRSSVGSSTTPEADLVWMRMGEARSMERAQISGSSSHAYSGVTWGYTEILGYRH